MTAPPCTALHCLTPAGRERSRWTASVADVAKEMGKKTDAQFVRAGKWQQSATLLDMDAPGIPAQFADQVKKQIGTTQTHESCLTPEQVKHPKEDFFTGADKNCRYEHFEWGDGKIHEAHCHTECDADHGNAAPTSRKLRCDDTWRPRSAPDGTRTCRCA